MQKKTIEDKYRTTEYVQQTNAFPFSKGDFSGL